MSSWLIDALDIGLGDLPDYDVKLARNSFLAAGICPPVKVLSSLAANAAFLPAKVLLTTV
jgi:hypothetical protein